MDKNTAIQQEKGAPVDSETTCSLLIEGPTQNGFFIRNDRMDVWDGENWRGFGVPQFFTHFMDAFREARKIENGGGEASP